MIGKTVEKTLHSGRSFERAQLTQLSVRKFVQRRSFQLTDVNAWRSVTQQESILKGDQFPWGSARVSRVGDRVLAIADFFYKDCFDETPKVRAGLAFHARRARYPAARVQKSLRETCRPKNQRRVD